jgi:hypothetical protein
METSIKHFSNKKLIIFILILFQIKVAFSQSKKEKIEILKVRTDSLIFVLDNERLINIDKTQQLNASIEIKNYTIDSLNSAVKRTNNIYNLKEQENIHLKDKVNEFSNKINNFKFHLKIKSDSLKIIFNELKKCKESINTKSDASKSEEFQFKKVESFSALNYDFDKTNGGNFQQNLDTIISKEKTRILNSSHAKRDLSLKIKLVNGETISLDSKIENDGNTETHFAYLFEDELWAKLYYVVIIYSKPGSGTKINTLIELDLNTGDKNIIVTNTGADYIFNKSKTFLITYGWYDSQEYVMDNQLQVVNILNKKKELILKEVEPINITWLSEYEFQCQLLKYSKEKEWPYYRIPSVDRNGKINRFKFVNGSWSKQ